MIKTLAQICILLSLTMSCNSDCDDCGSINEISYTIKNESNKRMELSWYTEANIVNNFEIKENESIVLYEASVEKGEIGELQVPPIQGQRAYFDSVKIASPEQSFVFIKDNCNEPQNPLCEDNYELVKSIDTGERIEKEWLFTIK
jgi:hypothetical protein